MATLTIRKLDDALKRKLRLRAAHQNRSMEEEVRHILRVALAQEAPPAGNLADAIRKRIRAAGGVTLTLPKRGPKREPPEFG